MANVVEIIIQAIDKTSGTVSAVDDKFKQLGGTFTKAGAIMTAGITAPLVLMGKSAVESASQLIESQNAVNQIFGESADVIHNFGLTSAETIGLATSEFNSLSIVTASLLRNVGMEESTVAEETVNLAQRAADMASVFNTDVDQAMQAIEAGLRGQTEPLTQYGVKLMQADINAKALAMGLAETTGELTQQDKAMAALALIYEQTSAVAGDFANTSDQFANSQRILSAQLKDVSAQLGAALMPLLVELIPIITQAVQWFSELDPGVKKVIVVFLGLVAVLGPIIGIVGGVITILGSLAAALGVTVGTVAAVAAGVVAAIAVIVAGLVAFWPQIKAFAQNVINEFNRIKSDVTKALTETYNTIKNQVTAWFNAGKDLVMGLVNGVKAAASTLINAVRGVVDDAIQGAKNLLGISSPSKVFQEIGSNMMAGWAKGIQMNASPQFAIQGATAGMVTSATPSGRSAPAGNTIVVNYSPVVSLADRYEAETKLVPYIESALRKIR